MRVSFLLLLMFSGPILKGQNISDVEMADTFRSEGKIYIVLAVILLILIALFFYLIRIDRKLTKLEKDKNIND